MKSAEQNILAFLKSNPSSRFPSAQLERMLFHNRNGTYAQPKAIRNRLQDLAREEVIKVELVGKLAYYSSKPKIKNHYQMFHEHMQSI